MQIWHDLFISYGYCGRPEKERPSQPTNRRLGLILFSGLSRYSYDGGDVMETKPFLLENPHHREPIRCFVRGCKNLSQHVTRFKHGTATLQVCLCNDCMKKSSKFILQGLGLGTKDTVN